MADLILRRLSPEDEDAFLKAVRSWSMARGFTFARDYTPEMKFADYAATGSNVETEYDESPSTEEPL